LGALEGFVTRPIFPHFLFFPSASPSLPPFDRFLVFTVESRPTRFLPSFLGNVPPPPVSPVLPQTHHNTIPPLLWPVNTSVLVPPPDSPADRGLYCSAISPIHVMWLFSSGRFSYSLPTQSPQGWLISFPTFSDGRPVFFPIPVSGFLILFPLSPHIFFVNLAINRRTPSVVLFSR